MQTDHAIHTSELLLLCLYGFFCLSIGGGLLPLLPVYAIQLGALPSQIGLYMALTYAGLTLSTLLTGHVVDKLPRRRLFAFLTGLALLPTLWWMAIAVTLWELIVATGLTWFFGGGCFALCLIFTGMAAGPKERGKIFGIIATAMGLGGLAGSLVAGAIADRWGYPTLLIVFALYSLLLALTPLLIPSARRISTGSDAAEANQTEATAANSDSHTGLGPALYLLVLATLFVGAMSFVAILGRSLAMNALTYTSTDIAFATAIGTAVGIPWPIWIGRLSDRYSRVSLLILCYMGTGLSLVLLAVATAPWQFWIASSLMAMNGGASGIINAIVTDIVPRRLVGTGLSYTNAAQWVGAVIGFSSAGYVVEAIGISMTFLAFTLLAPIAILAALRSGAVYRQQVAMT
ncbi:MAG: MFS transporter [Caldilineaceae bacterium]